MTAATQAHGKNTLIPTSRPGAILRATTSASQKPRRSFLEMILKALSAPGA